MLAGLFGSGNGSTSFAENIGVIAVTKVRVRINLEVDNDQVKIIVY